MMMNVLKMVIP